MDGFVTNASLIAGAGGGIPAHSVALTGVAALSAITTRLTRASMRAAARRGPPMMIARLQGGNRRRAGG